MTRELYNARWITLLENDQHIPYISMASGVMTVPINEQMEVIFIEEYSVALGENVLFLPAGAIEDGEAPDVTANRELQEEAGFKAKIITYLGVVRPMIKYLQATLTLFLGRELEPSRLQGDEPWEVRVRAIPFADVPKHIASGAICDSNVIAALYLARDFLARSNDQPDVM